jgi:regulator of nonsense transcripts 1
MSYTGYASSVISQQLTDSPTDGLHPGHALAPMSSRASSIAYSQYDRLPAGPSIAGLGALNAANDKKLGPRKLSIGSITPSDAVSSYAYKAGDDDTQSIAPSQAGVTEF